MTRDSESDTSGAIARVLAPHFFRARALHLRVRTLPLFVSLSTCLSW